MFEKVAEDSSLVKDVKTGALLNINNEGLKAYKKMKNSYKKNAELENKVSKLENEIGDIKNLLLQLMELKK